ncbi:exopolysaccharide transport family protein [Maribacter chungangensis]|uniref:Exopolysaccharide transport family protein n=1 Tax=Maribacter chungangensis TaxID=1069117 RepID=A0ABW3B4R5_9FLAO
MTLIDFIRLILKHIVLLVLVPLLLGVLVIVLTMNPSYEYSSQTILYTGLATGSSIEMDKKFSTQATNSAFDNLINIIKSRETQEEVAVRLLALHLMLPEANPKYISKELYDELKATVPEDIYTYVEKGIDTTLTELDTTLVNNPLPPEINRHNYEKTVHNLLKLMRSSTDNFMYELFSYEENKHYSLKALSDIKAQRINSSDLIKLTYTVNDPGICQQTLVIYNSVCIKNYKIIKENRSGSVVKYFENELAKAKKSLDAAEAKLLAFNKSSNIINYYEQSKAVAVVKEELEVDYKMKKAELAGIQAGTKRLEDKLKLQEVIQMKSNALLEKKKALGSLKYRMGLKQADIQSGGNETQLKALDSLEKQAEQLQADIQKGVDELYTYQNSIEGLQISKVLPDWMASAVETENLKAKIRVIDGQKDQFQETYAKYAPAGANMKRLEREISVSEQGYLEILHGLNLAKLKLQDSELASDLKTVDPPYYPLSPNPTKRAILIIAAAFLGGILTLAMIFVMEYFDDTLRNSIKASQETGLASFGMIPKIILDPRGIDLAFIQRRLSEIITQNILQYFGVQNSNKKPKTIIVFSTQKLEGKTVVSGNIARTLKQDGKKVLLLNYDNAISEDETQVKPKKKQKASILSKMLGYPDVRIDLNSPFLANATAYLEPDEHMNYVLDHNFYNAKSYTDILGERESMLKTTPDVVIIEVPAIIYNNYPVELITNADLDILVLRSNRIWSDADEIAIANLKETCVSKLRIIVNGVNINETESLLGDLPKTRNKFRKKIKSIFKFQFLSKNQI